MSPDTTIRRFRWRDLEEWTALFNTINGIAGTDKAYDTKLMRQFLSQPACKADENGFVAVSDGSLAGFAMVALELPISRAVASGGVLESHRGRGIGRGLLDSAIRHASAKGALVLHVCVPAGSEGPHRFLERYGFRTVRRYSIMRWEGHAVPPVELPPGFGLSTFRLGRDEQALTDLQNSAFAGAWGFCPNTLEDIEARLRLDTCDPDGVIVLTDGERLAGYNWTFRALGPDSKTGWIGMTGVHPDYRGRGIGRAVTLAGMEYLAKKGVRAIELDVDDHNTPAKDMYVSLGFRQAHRALWYEKRL